MVVSSAEPAHSEDAPRASPSKQAEFPDPQDPLAASLFADGQDGYAKGDYAEAARLLRLTYALDRSPLLFYPWAQAERMSGNCPLALELYQRFIEADPHEDQVVFATANRETCRAVLDGEAEGAPPSKSADALVQAHQAWLDDDLPEAYALAKVAYATEPDSASAHVMAIAACTLQDAAKARHAAEKLEDGARDAVAQLCARHGLEL